MASSYQKSITLPQMRFFPSTLKSVEFYLTHSPMCRINHSSPFAPILMVAPVIHYCTYFSHIKFFEYRFSLIHFISLKIFFFREGKGERKSGKETSMCGCPSHPPLTGDLACNPGMHSDRESNQ